MRTTRSCLPAPDFIPKRVLVHRLHDACASFRTERKSRLGTAAWMNSHRYDLFWCFVLNDYRTAKAERSQNRFQCHVSNLRVTTQITAVSVSPREQTGYRPNQRKLLLPSTAIQISNLRLTLTRKFLSYF